MTKKGILIVLVVSTVAMVSSFANKGSGKADCPVGSVLVFCQGTVAGIPVSTPPGGLSVNCTKVTEKKCDGQGNYQGGGDCAVYTIPRGYGCQHEGQTASCNSGLTPEPIPGE